MIPPVTIRNFRGVNRKDGGERVRNDEFWEIQNYYQASKGIFQKRFGTTQDMSVAQIPGANRISGIHRHYNPNKERYTLYFCEPNTSTLPDNTTDLTLTELTDGLGTIFNGGAVAAIRVCYSWIGWGQEQTPNSKSRAGFLSTPNLNSWSNPGHQSITLSVNTSSLKITAPGTFPAGVRGANIFVSVGTTCQMTFVGTITSASGFIIFRRYIGPQTAASDSFSGAVSISSSAGGSLPAGTYFISTAWVCDANVQDNSIGSTGGTLVALSSSSTIVITQANSQINFSQGFGSSTNGAKSAYVFIGLKDQALAPMVCVGIIQSGELITISSIPDNCNSQSHPKWPSYNNNSIFANACNVQDVTNVGRFGFLIKKDPVGNISEVFPSRTIGWAFSTQTADPINGGTVSGLVTYQGYPKTANDAFSTQPTNWGRSVYDPVFAYLNGTSYFVNGADIPWMTDGHGMGQIVPLNGTLLPPFPRFIQPFQNTLQVAGAGAGNQIYASNALAPFSWVVGGSGTNKRFMQIGDLFGDDVTALGLYTLGGDAVNDPRDFFLSFKKHGVWMKDTFPDPNNGVGAPLYQLTGRIGCVAYRSIVSTPVGVVFFANDGNWYRINSATEPRAIGTKVQPIFSHLVGNDSLMQMVTAVYHDYHLKVFYPSTTTSNYCDAQFWCDLRVQEGDPLQWVGPMVGPNCGPQIVLLGESDDESRLACTGDGKGVVKLDDTSTMQDLGVGFSSVLTTKTFRFMSEERFKRWLGALIEAYYDTNFTHDLLVEFFSDQYYYQRNLSLSSGGSTWDSSKFDQGLYGDALYQEIQAFIGQPNLIGRTLQVRITHSNPAQFVISAASLLFKPEKRLAV